jgi:hypothetical protein
MSEDSIESRSSHNQESPVRLISATNSHPGVPPALKGPSGRKGSKGRKPRSRHQRNSPWPPKAKYADGSDALAGHQSTEQAVFDPLLTSTTEPPSPKQVDNIYTVNFAPPKPFMSAQEDDRVHDNQVEGTHSNNGQLTAHEHEHEPLPVAPSMHDQMDIATIQVVNDAETEAAPDKQQVDPPRHSLLASGINSQTRHRREQSHPDDGFGRHGRREASDVTPHQLTSHGTSRINKSQKKPRTGRPRFPVPNPTSANQPKLSAENDSLVRIFAQALVSSETHTRDTMDAAIREKETAIASLRETIRYQSDVIELQKAEGNRLQRNSEQLKENSGRLEKFMKGIEKDYSRLDKQVKVHQQSCDKILQDKIAELESEKSALIQEFTTTLDAVDRSRRNLKLGIDDCYSRLVISESKKSDLTVQLCRLDHLYKEEKKRRSDLEQQTIPALRSLQELVEDGHTVLTNKLGTIQGSLDDTTADEDRNAHLKKCIDAVHSMQAIPFLTTKDVEKAEGILRSVHERRVFHVRAFNEEGLTSS